MDIVSNDLVVAKGLEIFRLMSSEPPAVFDRRFWEGKLMQAAMEHPELKLPLFHFIDVLPSLATSGQVVGHLKEYFLAGDTRLTGFPKFLLSSAGAVLPAGLAAGLLRWNVRRLAAGFIIGETPEAALGKLKALWRRGGGFTVDLLGEAAISENEADRYRDRYLRTIDVLAEELPGWPAHDAARERFFPRLNLSIKLSSLYSRIGPSNYEDSLLQVKTRLRPICRKLMRAGGQVFIDMETVSLKELTFEAFTSLLEEPEFQEWEHAGIALQAYLKSAEDDVRRLIQWARQRGRRIHVRLVKGAYWEYERAIAAQKGWPLPVFERKSETDACYERCVELLLTHHADVTLAAATHNVRSIAWTLAAAETLGVPRERFEFQALYGMAGPVRQALQVLGFPVREYVPIGELLPGMAYLVRRLLENTSNESFLRKTFAAGLAPEVLLADPRAEAGALEAPPPETNAFANEPPLDFSKRENRETFAVAIRAVRDQMGRHVSIVYGGKEYQTAERLISLNPAAPSEVVCTASAIDRNMADRALAAARTAQADWGKRPPAERAELLFRAAAIARRRRFELAAWELLEVGKNRVEADADVCEAIDFLEYYGREMLRLGAPQKLGRVPGEENRYWYEPRGVGLVVAPWNFPIAISVGMVSAALVTGNAVLYKPSSLSPMSGRLVYEMFAAAGIPEGVLNFVPGSGSAVGDYLVEHPSTDFILFTGSLQVGLGILEKAGRTGPSQAGPKKVVIETGGKNAIIVDADADLDQAVPGVIQSAFGFQGQKCSACSRVIVLRETYDRFCERLAEAVRDLPAGSPEDPKNFVGPVVDAGAQERILEYLELGKREGRVLAQAPVPADGYYVPPTVFADLPADSRILREEIFGPVLAVIRAGNIGEAIATANASAYALTGGLYSRSPGNIGKTARAFQAGNLYVNRPITGALVGRQPFGGFKMSGVGSKAGGPDYLQQFMVPRTLTENTLRRGFTPEDVA
ncbi:proline dehydrogenase family protein [Methylococcus sp. ANG]|uniref:proline dehydrogenase family protein n=1 Tax=Methylococcus sp. ANG TaxID=3231903 RepID=UPI00345B3EB1